MTVPITLNNVADLTNTVTAQQTINTNSAAITAAFTTALATTGDKMKGTLDMDNNRILNLPAPATLNEPARLKDVTSTSIALSLPSLTGVVVGSSAATVVTTFSGAGNLPVTQLASGAGASNITFFRGDGTWASPATLSLTAGTGITVSSATVPVIAVATSVPTAISNDTNVTGSISGNILTLGWTSALALSRGGINNTPTASAGGQVFSNATGFAVSTGATTANQTWLSAVTGTPVLSTSVWPVDVTANNVLFGSANHTWTNTSTVTGLTINTSTLNNVAATGTFAGNFSGTFSPGMLCVSTSVPVNLNANGTDVGSVVVVLPGGFTSYKVQNVHLFNFSTVPSSTAVVAIFSGTNGGGLQLGNTTLSNIGVAGFDSTSVANSLAVGGLNTVAFTKTGTPNIYIRMGSGNASVCTATVTVAFIPMA